MSWHLVGIGGIGMSALAQILLQKNEVVSGSDHRISKRIEGLQAAGAQIAIGATNPVPQGATVVYSSAIRPDHPERVPAALHRADLLAELMRGYKPLVVTGTHGKTTVTSLVAWLLLEAGRDPAFALGGIIGGMAHHGRHGQGEFFVAEADESDGSFLKLKPHSAIVTNVEADHLDHYGSIEALQQAMRLFMESAAHLVWCGDDPWLRHLQPPGISYGLDEACALRATEVEQDDFSLRFLVRYRGDPVAQLHLPLIGAHNVCNALGAAAMARQLGLSWEEIRTAIATFPGVSRRCEVKGEVAGILTIDDYAHHPTAIATTLKGIRTVIGARPLVALIEPHRYSRWQALGASFKEAVSEADRVVITDVCAAGEDPIADIDGPSLARLLGAEYLPPDRRRPQLDRGDCLVTMGAGSVTRRSLVHVGLIYGGPSPEHDISVISAQWFAQHLDPSRYQVSRLPLTRQGRWLIDGASHAFDEAVVKALCGCDVLIPVLHGNQGEDGLIAALLENLQLRFVGSDFRASAVCMDKVWSKQIAVGCGIPTARFSAVRAGQPAVVNGFSYPLYVKPVHLGSSIGVSRVTTARELMPALEAAFALDNCVLIEQEIIGREFEFCILGDEVAYPAEILKEGAVHSFTSKYGAFACPIDPAPKLPDALVKQGQRMARTLFKAMGCRALARVDAFLDATGTWWFNEINPFPGCTPTSAFPLAWAQTGRSPAQVIDQLIDDAYAQ